MDVFQEIIAPTSVGHSISCYFITKEEENLIVVKNTLLQIFKVHNNKLVLINEFKLNGAIQNINFIKLANSELDQLLVLTKFAKLSIIAWDHENHTITTQSLHYYESEFLKTSINKQETYNNANLRIEPSGACSLIQYNDTLAFLSFKRTDDDVEEVKLSCDEEFFEKSIILPASSLETSVSFIIDTGFLYNYRDPTLAILYNKSLTWAGDLSIKKDTVSFVLLSLDLSNGSSTPILNVENLPYDSYEIKPLANPLNGCLLIGCNQIVHIDNSGNVKGIGTNSFFKNTTDLKLNDQSNLELFLEDCQIEVLENNRILIIEKKGGVYTLSFNVDGKNIKDLSILKVEADLKISNPQTISTTGGLLFIGSSTSDSILLKISQQKREQTKIETKDKKVDSDEHDDLYDDLYGGNENVNLDDNAADQNLEFQLLDTLVNHGPISSFTLGKLSPEAKVQGLSNPNFNDVSIVATTGEHQSGSLTAFKPTIQPHIYSTLKFNNINKTWNLLDKYLLTTDPSNFKSEIFLINDNFKIFQSLDFKNNNITIHTDTVLNNKRILQVTSSNIYLFDLNFKQLVQIKVNFEILSAHIFDPFVMIASSKGEIKIFEIDPLKGRKLNKVILPGLLDDLILISGTIAKTSLLNKGGVKRTSDDKAKESKNLAFLVTTVNNQILIFDKNHNEKVYQISNINKLSEISGITEFENPKGLIPDPFIKEIELLELGDEHCKDEILTILTIGGELIFYKTIKTEIGLKFVKLDPNLITGAPENIYSESTVLERKLVPLDIDGKSVIFVTGKQPYFIIKTSQSLPKIFKFTSNNAIHICKLGSSDGIDKFMYVDNQKNARICSFSSKNNPKVSSDFSNNLPIMRVNFGETLNNVTFHETSNLFIVSTLQEIRYDAKDEEGLYIVGTEPEKPKAESYKSKIKMVEVKEWEVIDEIKFQDNEVVNDIKTENLIISTRSKKTKEFLIFGIGKYRLEDLSVYGEYCILEILSIVPDPTKPNVNFKFKQIAKEAFKGAVTKVGQVAGRFLTGQAQKILIRRLQQDYSVVPNAFYDTASYVSEFKSFRNLLLIGDTLKSILLLGFDAEPDRLILLGKDLQDINIFSADFIVDNGEIYFLIADDEENIHLLSYQPDDPKSLSGQILIRKSIFKLNSLTTTMRMLHKHEEFKTGTGGSFQAIGANVDGSIYKVTPVDEAVFRRLYILQQQLSDKMPPFAGLNARANRYADNEVGFKPILEYNLLKYWFLWLNIDKRLSTSLKVGRAAYLEIWRDLIEVQNSMNVLSFENI